jgi:hypothetical protein
VSELPLSPVGCMVFLCAGGLELDILLIDQLLEAELGSG